MVKYLSILVLVFFSLVGHGQSNKDKVTLSGYIKDAANGETLIGATAYVTELGQGISTNVYGFYSLSVPAGDYNIKFEYLGFEPQSLAIALTQNKTMNIELVVEAAVMDEIVIVGEAEDKNVSEVEMSVNKMDIQTIKSMPTLLGEVEVIRSLQLLPGVTTVGEGASGFNVRGGSIDQNLILLDEAPVYNSSHLFGFFSVFNPDAVKDVKLYKGGIPSRYGGRLSSILDVRMKEGNNKSLAVNGGIGLIFSRLSIEAPIIKDKSSFIIAGRRSYIDVLAQPFLNDDLKDSALNFYDLTLKTNYILGEKDRLFLSGYFGRDNFGFGDQAGFSWGNSTGSFRWNHLFSDKLFSNVTFYFSDYDYKLNFGDESTNKFDWDARILNYSIKPELNLFVNPNNIFRFGGQSILYQFDPGNAVGVSEGEQADFSLPRKRAFESALYIENERELGSKIKINYGLRYSLFNYVGGTAYDFEDNGLGERKTVVGFTEYDKWENVKSYSNLEPRFSFKYQLAKSESFKLSYNRTTQYIHLVSNTTASTPVDVWTPATNNIKPSIADQVAVGYFKNLKNNTYELSTEVYYKKMAHLIDYIDAADLLLNEFVEGDLLEGDGRAYGLELQFQKVKGKTTGWVSYTLARTERKIEGINNGTWYPSRYDQTHSLSLSLFREVSKRLSFSANFVLNSGTPASFPNSRYTVQGYVIPHNGSNSRNNVRIPVYHRLDIGATLKGKEKPGKKWSGEWVFSVYNLYNRRNPFSIYFKQDGDRVPVAQVPQTSAYRLSVIGSFIPSISYNFKFQ